MENNNHKKRKVMLIAAFAVAVIALAGVGYAAVTGYMATTVNSDNTIKSVSFTATQTTYTGAFSVTGTDEDLKVNSYTDTTYPTATPLYSLAKDVTVPDEEIDGKTYNLVKIGGDMAITLTGKTTAAYDVTVKVTGTMNGTGTDGWVYVFGIGTNYAIISAGECTIELSGLTPDTTQNLTANLYIASEKVFEDWPNKVWDDSEDLTGYSGYATAKVNPVVSGKMIDDVDVFLTFTVA